MKLYLVSFFLFTGTTVKAQNLDSLPVATELSMQGRVSTKGVDIEGHELRVKRLIHHTYLDSANRYLYIKAENGLAGDVLMQYSLKDKRVRWSRNISEDDAVFYSGPYVFHNTNSGTGVVNPETGKDLWRTTNDNLVAIDSQNQLAFFQGEDEERAIALDLRTGQKKWERKITFSGNWNFVEDITDSTLLISASGIHVVNPVTGKGWDYDMTTTCRKSLVKLIPYSAPVSSPGMMFTTMSHRYKGSLITDLRSNVLYNPHSICMASADELVSFSYSGEKQWAQPLKGQISSKSTLYRLGENILFVNCGYAKHQGNWIWYGQPFVAAYDTATGKQVFETLMEESPIRDFRVEDSSLYVLTKDNIAMISLKTGAIMQNVKFPEGAKLYSFVEKNRFVMERDNYEPIYRTDATALFVETTSGIYKITKDLTSAQMIPMRNTYWRQAEYGDRKLIIGNNKTLLIDGEKVIADMGNLRHPVMIGNTIYEVDAGTIAQYDIKYP